MSKSKITTANLLKPEEIKQHLKPRQRDSHKGDFGNVLIIGGNKGMWGAAAMAALAALRTGAGRVTTLVNPINAPFISTIAPEIMSYGIEDVAAVKQFQTAATVVAIGPGLGEDKWALQLLQQVLTWQQPLVIDASALNIIAKQKINFRGEHAILTPHVGEAARLLDKTTTEIQQQRLLSAAELAQKFAATIVLKGHGTIVQQQQQCWQCDYGNPGMATAGMGDVLTGVIAALLAQGLSLKDAARMGVLIHALAGDKAANINGERGIIATDVIAKLQNIIN